MNLFTTIALNDSPDHKIAMQTVCDGRSSSISSKFDQKNFHLEILKKNFFSLGPELLDILSRQNQIFSSMSHPWIKLVSQGF
jgi:hypothetical protein